MRHVKGHTSASAPRCNQQLKLAGPRAPTAVSPATCSAPRGFEPGSGAGFRNQMRLPVSAAEARTTRSRCAGPGAFPGAAPSRPRRPNCCGALRLSALGPLGTPPPPPPPPPPVLWVLRGERPSLPPLPFRPAAPLGLPRPHAAEPGPARPPCALGEAGFGRKAPGPLALCWFRPATLGVRGGGGAGKRWDAFPCPSCVALSPRRSGQSGAGGRPCAHRRTFPRVPVLGRCPNAKRRPASTQAAKGRLAPRTGPPPFMPPPSRAPRWLAPGAPGPLGPPRSAGRGAVRGGAVQTCSKDSWVQTCESPQGHPLINDDVLPSPQLQTCLPETKSARSDSSVEGD